jgi:tetratricopeptide (TPR) repeat protein
MKTRIATIGMVFLFFASGWLIAQSGQELFQQGVAKEQLGEYENAIKIYERIVREFPSNRQLVARSKLQMSECWLKLGDSKADGLISELITDYKEYAEIVAQAQRLKERSSRVSRLTEKDVLVLADFVNTTGDSIFDETLRAALEINLEESPLLKILEDTQARKQLPFMGRRPDERITNPIAREISIRTGNKAMISGLIATLGTRFAITLQAVNCADESALARSQAEAVDKEHVLGALAEAARTIRERLGESLASIEKLKSPRQVTTTSLEAFQAFVQGGQRWDKSFEAIPFFERAVKLDPDFAVAYVSLAGLYRNVGDPQRAREHSEKAFALSDKVSERERLSIAGHYYKEVTGEWEKAIEVYSKIARLYPGRRHPHNSLGQLYSRLGQLEKAAQEFQEGMRLTDDFDSSDDSTEWSNLVLTNLTLGRFDEARSVARRAAELGKDSPALHLNSLRLAFIENDENSVAREMDWFSGKPEEFQALGAQSQNAATRGQFRKAEKLQQQALDMRRVRGLNAPQAPPNAPEPMRMDPAAPGLFNSALSMASELAGRLPAGSDLNTPGWSLEFVQAQCPTLLPSARARLAELAGTDVQPYPVARFIGLCGDTNTALDIVNEATKSEKLRDISAVQRFQLPLLRAMIEIGRNQPSKAVEMLEAAAPYERAEGEVRIIYFRAYAYTRSGMHSQAIAEYQKLIDNKGLYQRGPFYAANYVWLARTAKLAGDTARARQAYEGLFAFWKDADPDAPLLLQARKEYEALGR